MPTGTCHYPAHHGPSAGPPLGLVLAIAAGALIVTHWHAVLVTLAVVAVLAAAGAAVVMLWHSHRGAPYDASWSDTEPHDAVTVTAQVRPLAARVAELEQQLADRCAIEAPQQHLHLHGVTSADVAELIAGQGIPQPAIEESK
jgi:hypothetical protein